MVFHAINNEISDVSYEPHHIAITPSKETDFSTVQDIKFETGSD